MRTALKIVPPILLRWPLMSKADGGGVAAEVSRGLSRIKLLHLIITVIQEAIEDYI